MFCLTVLMDGLSPRRHDLAAQHGLSFLLETAGFSLIFDCGAGESTWSNALGLGRDLTRLDAIVLSHGHYDHAGGLTSFPQRLPPVYTSPGFLCPKYARCGPGYTCLSPGFSTGFWAGVDHRTVDGQTPLRPDILLIGGFPRYYPFEAVSGRYLRRGTEGMEPDEFTDEICLAVVTERGVTMVVGCAHPGICNMVRHVQTVTGRPVIRLVGGLHLNKAEPARLEATAQVMAGWPQLTCLGLNHCTGQAAETRLAQGRQAGHLAPGDCLFWS